MTFKECFAAKGYNVYNGVTRIAKIRYFFPGWMPKPMRNSYEKELKQAIEKALMEVDGKWSTATTTQEPIIKVEQ